MPAIPHRTSPGRRFPVGATPDTEGVNFSVFSRHATAVELLLYERADSPGPFQVVALDPETNCTHFFWHVRVDALRPGAAYTWRVDGPDDAARTGRRFAPRRELVDPWARAVSDTVYDREQARDPEATGHSSLRAIVVEPLEREPLPPASRGLESAVMYELHVGSFTRHPSSGVAHPGTFAGLAEKIPYLRELGVTHVELMPIAAFDASDVPRGVAARGLRNVWGYSPHSFHSPHPGYCVTPDAGTHLREARALVDALHAADIGVVLDVVFNHTAEGGTGGPWLSFKGLANEIFYHLDPADRRRYLDYTGCGNTINCNHPLVTQFLVRCLEWWAGEIGVDGFRFDLASVFSRGEAGAPMGSPPLPWTIEFSRALADRVLIAEAWDAAGLYQVGSFPGLRWAEWNGRFRDVARRFARGDAGVEGLMATCLAGSADLYADDGRRPSSSINFVTCHDGFTLRDLVSYSRKRNEVNGEGGRDGRDDEISWNCGAEGETDDEAVEERRGRDARNLMALLMLAVGTPMLLAGDELLRTQRGNNNAWCQDNESSWIDWGLRETRASHLRFVKELIALRRRHPSIARSRFLRGRPVPGRQGLLDVAWHGVALDDPPWRGGPSRVLAFTLGAERPREPDLHVVLNMSDRDETAALPIVPGRRWRLAVDTSREPPGDIVAPADQRVHEGGWVPIRSRSVVVLEAGGG